MVRIQVLLAISLFVVLTFLPLAHFTTSKPTGFSLKLIPRDFLASPFNTKNVTQMERFQKMVEFSKARANCLEQISYANAAMDPNNIHCTMTRLDALYAVKVYLGARREIRMLAMDTASDLIWTQCHPCIRCFTQSDPIYNSSRSSTYRKLPSNHPACLSPYRRVNGECIYNLIYANGASTRGILSLEKFWLPNKVSFSTKSDMIFGCSNDNQRFNFDNAHRISGMLGMSRSSKSFVKQLGILINGRFSYCFSTTNGKMAPTSILSFGNDISLPRFARSTPFLPDDKTHKYYLNLLGISVAGLRMQFPPKTFSLKQDGTGGFIIDTGALPTFIVPNAYDRLIGAFENYFRPFNFRKLPDASQGIGLCYELKPKFTAYPSMTFHFQGADYFVKPKYVHFIDKGSKKFCVAVMRGSSKTILGVWQQQSTRFVYDENRNVLQFAPENC